MRGASTVGLLVLIGLAAIAAVSVETTLLPRFPLPALRPDLLLVLCVYVGLHSHSLGGSAAAFLLGYAADSFSGGTIGLHAFAMSFVFTLVYLLSRRLWMGSPVANAGVVFVAALVKALTVALLLSVYLAEDFPWQRLLFGRMWLEAGSAALVSLPIFALLDQGRHRWALD